MKPFMADKAAPRRQTKSEAFIKPEVVNLPPSRIQPSQPAKPVGAMTYTVSNGADVWAFLRLGRT